LSAATWTVQDASSTSLHDVNRAEALL
jgi:hypothetical protein